MVGAFVLRLHYANIPDAFMLERLQGLID